MIPNLLQFLCDLSELSDLVFRADSIEMDKREALAFLLGLGGLEPGPRPETVTCNACDGDHPASIQYDSARACYVHFCPEAGWVSLADADLATFRFRPEWLAEWLTEALPIASPVRRAALIPDQIWHLGDSECGGRMITCIFARRITSLVGLDRLASALSPVHRADRGIVITTSLYASREVRLPGGYEFLQFPDVVREDAGRLLLDQALLASRIAGMPEVTAKGAPTRPGRPTPKDHIASIYKLRRERGLPFVNDSVEAKAIVAEWPRHAPGQTTPGHSTVRSHLATLKRTSIT